MLTGRNLSWIFDLGLPGLVFLGVCIWLVRKLVKAARTESDLESERLSGALDAELRAARERSAQVGSPKQFPVPSTVPAPIPVPPAPATRPLDGADVSGADPLHLPLVAQMAAEREQQLRAQHPGAVGRRVEILWVRSNATHAVWCERRHAASAAARSMSRDVVCVAQIDHGKVTERWYFG